MISLQKLVILTFIYSKYWYDLYISSKYESYAKGYSVGLSEVDGYFGYRTFF
ncbi:hypothetical protein KQI86_03255 [Clostridium sp. MSJ-11]|uniref:Uncharacterized protein n=1 Tax=Clostridium mobile TaxID=2841512 RepID=A0ABS6EDP7_9CLOT|nr:hypothetical protein [Clostridium mobile]MBU5483330.1 hypothetical protein [Clostridium mobile]